MTRPERAHLFVSASTHSGMRGKNNEDRYAVSTHRFGPNQDIPSVLAVVCDGIGGHNAGEVAAEIAVETISQGVAASDATEPLETLQQAIQQASEAVREQSEANPERKGMGSTCVCAWVIGERLYTASVGDSRLYILRDGVIQQVTTDHTWIQEAIEFGALTPEQARGHPNSHVIRRYLGAQSPPEVDFRMRLKPNETNEQALANQGVSLQAGDILLLVSDGLTDLVDPLEIKNILDSFDRKEALQQLIDLANQRGGHDNITTVMLVAPTNFVLSEAAASGIDMSSAEAEAAKTVVTGQTKDTSRKKLILTCGIVALLIAVLSATSVGVYLYFRPPEATPTPITTLDAGSGNLLGLPDNFSSATTSPTNTTVPTATSTERAARLLELQEETLTPWPTNTFLPPTQTQTSLPPTVTLTLTPTE